MLNWIKLLLVDALVQCRRHSKRSEGALAESGGALKQTVVLRIKTDIQIF